MAKPRSRFLTRFLSDFTLGFSDGLTVPFALTAGLSSLGRPQTVIYAGLAEICAGSISMGIGGYLSTIDDVREAEKTARSVREMDDEEKRSWMLAVGSSTVSPSEQSTDASGEELVRRRLENLDLSPKQVSDILSVVELSHPGLDRAATHARSFRSDPIDKPLVPLPWLSGLSIAIGYIIGGLIPLLPYYVASTIGAALSWSIKLCLLALFTFGFFKSLILRTGKVSWAQSAWEGLQMLLLGGTAAAVAVICIKCIEGNANSNEI